MNKTTRYILIVSIVCAFAVATYANTLMQPAPMMGASLAPSLPESAFNPTSQTSSTGSDNGNGNGGGAGASTSITYDTRAKDIQVAISGNLRKGTFEETVESLHDLTDNYTGYIYKETLTFANDFWTGETIIRIPQNQSTQFVFDTRNAIATFGKVISIQTQITDIQGEIASGESLPYASIKIDLTETIIQTPDNPLATTVPMLYNIGTLFAQGLIIGIPTFLGFLGIGLLMTKGLYPIVKRAFPRSKQTN
jgi:hypothetical protein